MEAVCVDGLEHIQTLCKAISEEFGVRLDKSPYEEFKSWQEWKQKAVRVFAIRDGGPTGRLYLVSPLDAKVIVYSYTIGIGRVARDEYLTDIGTPSDSSYVLFKHNDRYLAVYPEYVNLITTKGIHKLNSSFVSGFYE